MSSFYSPRSGQVKRGRTIGEGAFPGVRNLRRLWLSTLLPLFPLDLVLLPGTPLPLHIFEPRYREMISECLDQNQQFGVLRGKDQELAEIGCTAEILTVTKKYPDGRMDIVTEGRARKIFGSRRRPTLVSLGWFTSSGSRFQTNFARDDLGSRAPAGPHFVL